MIHQDEFFMQKALELALQGQGLTSPNPMVGSVIVKQGEIIGQGFHKAVGKPHGEIDALQNIPNHQSAEGSTLYVNLEPCCHFGRTPPCVNRLIEEKVKRVVIGTLDPNPKVNGEGLQRLVSAGIDVSVGILEKECRKINRAFFTFFEKQRPYISLKVASSLDSKIATRTGESRWLSSKESRIWAHQLRSEVDGILVGIGTLLADNPSLTVRHVEGRNPKRFVMDTHLRTSLDSSVVSDSLASQTTIFTACLDPEKRDLFQKRGVTVQTIPLNPQGQLELSAILSFLHQQECQHLLVEGGGKIHGAFLQENLVDEFYFVMTPWLLGQEGIPAFAFSGHDQLADSFQFEHLESRALGKDVLIHATKEK